MASRKEYIEKLAAKLHEWDADIDELREKAELSGYEIRRGFRRRITDLMEKRERAAALLEDLHETGDDAWDDVRLRVDRLYEEVKNIFRKAA